MLNTQSLSTLVVTESDLLISYNNKESICGLTYHFGGRLISGRSVTIHRGEVFHHGWDRLWKDPSLLFSGFI